MPVTKPKKTDKKLVVAAINNLNAAGSFNHSKESRMNFRLATDIKERIARAAALTGQDLTEFAVSALSEKADVIIERHDQMLLGSKDYNFFLDALAETTVSEPSEPSERSRAVAERYRQGTRKGVRYQLAD